MLEIDRFDVYAGHADVFHHGTSIDYHRPYQLPIYMDAIFLCVLFNNGALNKESNGTFSPKPNNNSINENLKKKCFQF